jgi:hypothetical protein
MVNINNKVKQFFGGNCFEPGDLYHKEDDVLEIQLIKLKEVYNGRPEEKRT